MSDGNNFVFNRPYGKCQIRGLSVMANRSRINRRQAIKLSLGTVMATAALNSTAKSIAAEPSHVPADNAKTSGMPYGTICGRKISRLIMGSNTPGSHSRDLMYVTALGKAYNTKARMLDTYQLLESRGINTILQGSSSLIKEYNTKRGGRLRIIRPVRVSKDDTRETIKKNLARAMKDELVAMFYIMGDCGDYLAMAKRIDVVGTAMEVAKQLGVILGLGGHSLQVVTQCCAAGIKPDFYMKTFHHDNYWSATPKENREDFCWYDDKGGNSYSGKTGDHNRFHDNIWCLDAPKTIEVMNKVKVPWIAFKVLAAGAISPTSGFKFSFHNGADFIAVGMIDIQVTQNVQILKSIFARPMNRNRPWIS